MVSAQLVTWDTSDTFYFPLAYRSPPIKWAEASITFHFAEADVAC